MRTTNTLNKCHRCGATSYKPVIERDAAGSMKPSGQHQCVGCGLTFGSIDEWRTGNRHNEQTPQQTNDKA